MTSNTEHVELMKKPEWYSDAQKYWNAVPATVDGMLGGFETIDPIDVKGSISFIKEFVDQNIISTEYACDCGAGIGRVTKNFLLQVPFKRVDLVEQAESFVQQAKSDYLAQEIEQGKVGNVFCQGLQGFTPEEGKYDLIWCQWVLGHLTDEHFINFFKRCIKGLKPNGFIGVKENNASKEALFDDEDSSVTRPNQELKRLFAEAGLNIVKEEVQKGFPAGLFAVRMYLLKPQ
ncbi:hypothetical protein G6F57_004674 [Rhizopus arrhizus]|uniref:Alpha N-terminal protein methyltransferase 1 n=1 Tax=Rhizopus oryzae TaxID=64495 RepID=A0A9P7BUA3_RHIOR|nr:hypothetical protein G6F23_011825 [Rhizopus arrhizus]KAG0767698.1 hypothetical protein G6F24_002567 [Rhizopus arrhizus]KAG0800565.1 hypothetical protein G6F22_002109 [Rhizopus arrhizus]KAG0810870.1 hypothetical protein G6F20_007612 [Rhizopus arrhizus]KAG0833419.1 hypothetical protein G6F19_005711 [Rhizopus arrhizus]